MPEKKLLFLIDAENKAEAVFKQVGRNVDDLKGHLDTVKTEFDKIAKVAVGAFTAINTAAGMAIKQWSEAGSQIYDLHLKTGISTKSLSELKYGLEQSGSSLEDFEKAIKAMSKRVIEMREEVKNAAKEYQESYAGALEKSSNKTKELQEKLAEAEKKLDEMTSKTHINREAVEKQIDKIHELQRQLAGVGKEMVEIEKPTIQSADNLRKIGLTIDDISKGSPEEIFWKIAKGVAGLKDNTERLALAQEFFGRSGAELLPFLSEGAEGIEKLRKQANELGIVFDATAAKEAKMFSDKMKELKEAINGVRNAIAVQLADVLLPYADKIKEIIVNIRNWVKEHRELIYTVVFMLERFGSLIAILFVLSKVVGLVTSAFNLLFGVAGTLISITKTVGSLLSVISFWPALLILAIVAIIALLVAIVIRWKQVKDGLLIIWELIKAKFHEMYLWVKLKMMEWHDRFIEIWQKIKDKVIEVWTAIHDAIKSKIEWLLEKIDWLVQKYERMKEIAGDVGARVSGAVSGVWGAATGWATSVWGAIKGSRQFGGYIPETGTYLLHKGEYVVPAGGAAGVVVNINGGYYLSERAAEEIGDLIIQKLKKTIKL